MLRPLLRGGSYRNICISCLMMMMMMMMMTTAAATIMMTIIIINIVVVSAAVAVIIIILMMMMIMTTIMMMMMMMSFKSWTFCLLGECALWYKFQLPSILCSKYNSTLTSCFSRDHLK
jgi:hypothetical protein